MGCKKFVNLGVKACGAFCLINYRRVDGWWSVCFLVLNVLVYIEILVYADWHKAVAIL